MTKKPNILFIMSDEHNARMSGFAGDTTARTQNLDRLAASSIQFDNAFCSSPVCTSSRMSLMTGKEPNHCAAWNNHWIIFPEHTTWPQHFAEHGYTTCLVGKMHFGGRDQMQGFQYRPYGDLKHGLGHQPEPLRDFPCYDNPESAGISEIPESLNVDVVTSREASAFILEHEDEQPDKPWMVCVGYCRPHSPLRSPGRYFRRYLDKVEAPEVGFTTTGLDPYAQSFVFPNLSEADHLRARAGYYACIDFIDDCIGELLDKLEAQGCLENTIVIYTSDHGEMAGQHGMWGKGVYFDASVGVPLLIKGPGIPEGHRRSDELISLSDIFPTTCGLAGIPVPDELDGKDFSEMLKYPDSPISCRDHVTNAYYPFGIILKDMEQYEGEPKALSAMRLVRDKKYKYVDVIGSDPLLFDLECDPYESNNLAQDPEFEQVLKEMRSKWSEDFSWDSAHEHFKKDLKRLPEYKSGIVPTTPNQYRSFDGKLFDAESELYASRWLSTRRVTGGLIPQQAG